MNNVVHAVAENFRDEIESGAKKVGAVYSDEVELRQISDESFAVVVPEQKEKIANLGTALMDYQPLTPKVKEIAAILKGHGPYPSDLLPYRHDPKEFRLVYRKVSVAEYEMINKRLLERSFDKVRSDLLKAKIPSSKVLSQKSVEDSEWADEWAWNDLTFNVVRSELGIRTEKEPVWVPAVENFRKGDMIPFEKEPLRLMKEDSLSEDEKSFVQFQRAILR